MHGFLWFQRPPEITCVCVSRHRTSVSTARKCWSLGRKCPSCSSCLRQMKCALLLVRITHTPHAPASSPFLCRSLNWVSISNFRLKRLIITYVLQLLFPNLFLYLLDHHFTFFSFCWIPPTVHFNAYCPSFIGQYCRVSALLELESLMSQQALREAFSEAELLTAKKKHQQVQEHIQVRSFSQPVKTFTPIPLQHLGEISYYLCKYNNIFECYCTTANGGGVA